MEYLRLSGPVPQVHPVPFVSDNSGRFKISRMRSSRHEGTIAPSVPHQHQKREVFSVRSWPTNRDPRLGVSCIGLFRLVFRAPCAKLLCLNSRNANDGSRASGVCESIPSGWQHNLFVLVLCLKNGNANNGSRRAIPNLSLPNHPGVTPRHPAKSNGGASFPAPDPPGLGAAAKPPAGGLGGAAARHPGGVRGGGSSPPVDFAWGLQAATPQPRVAGLFVRHVHGGPRRSREGGPGGRPRAKIVVKRHQKSPARPHRQDSHLVSSILSQALARRSGQGPQSHGRGQFFHRTGDGLPDSGGRGALLVGQASQGDQKERECAEPGHVCSSSGSTAFCSIAGRFVGGLVSSKVAPVIVRGRLPSPTPLWLSPLALVFLAATGSIVHECIVTDCRFRPSPPPEPTAKWP